MKTPKKHPKIKSNLHPKSKHRERYNFKELINSHSELAEFVKKNDYGDESIDFFNPEAVKALNTSLLKHFYNINYWEIPENYLCPPIPGRADYIHHIAQLLGESNYGNTPIGNKIKCLDIGVGANCIYPIIGTHEYGWSFIGSDIDAIAIKNSTEIVIKNEELENNIEFRLQANPKDIFYGIIRKDERIDIAICNPPFHASAAEANAGTQRKLRNLKGENSTDEIIKNFGGQNSELWCDGGENKFVRNMIRESKKFSETCFWFTTLVSKQSNLKSIYKTLENEKAVEVKTIPMGQGNKTSRIVAWTFLSIAEQKDWRNTTWNK
ncbi:MAG: 23S rRNA (adenine(1618)-N(6))-methyltransferase RlmF [Flavobacteriales bacterium]|nr:23S rRNA (adenine(1618)-N(6))-methyltransferase RlmF [Flavobacteriales bacterium]